MKNKIYISGKVTGLPFNEVKEKFGLWQEIIEGKGYEAINPVEHTISMGLEHEDWDTIMKSLIPLLCECDAIFLLADYSESRGAMLELHIAKELGLTVLKKI